jgi:pantetheine-phosphate adenylyltransferase
MPDRLGLYPGTFDPITRGHLDIIQRATRVVDRLVVAVAVSDGKEPLFGLDERVRMVKDEVASLGSDVAARIEVCSFSSLLVHFARDVGAGIIVRGLRAVSDFEYEFQMAGMNRNLYPDVETLFLTPDEKYMFISATIVREIARFGGDISKFVHPHVAECLRRKVGR